MYVYEMHQSVSERPGECLEHAGDDSYLTLNEGER